MNSILSQIEAIADHALSEKFSLSDLQKLSRALCVASAWLEVEIIKRQREKPIGLLDRLNFEPDEGGAA